MTFDLSEASSVGVPDQSKCAFDLIFELKINQTMKVVILAGGLGTRLAEETEVKPKPMVEIGGYPILWHIMKTYSH